jgi:hypothetical protein
MDSSKDKSAKTEITLKGSVAIVSDFFFTAINSILYQRGACLCRFDLHQVKETVASSYLSND